MPGAGRGWSLSSFHCGVGAGSTGPRPGLWRGLWASSFPPPGRNSTTNIARLGLSNSGIRGTKKSRSRKHILSLIPSPRIILRPASPSSDHLIMIQLWTPTSATHPGRRFAQVIKLKPECVAKYKEVHAAIWPEVAKQIRECNIQDCSFPPPLFSLSFPVPLSVPVTYARVPKTNASASLKQTASPMMPPPAFSSPTSSTSGPTTTPTWP